MSSKSVQLTDNLYHYMLSVSLREAPILQEIREFTHSMPNSKFMVAPEQGQLLAFFIKALNAKRVLEIGTYTGYSSTAMALALSPEGQLVCFDICAEFTQHAERFWRQAGLTDKITLYSAPAIESLQKFIDAQDEGFDLIFIDADKPSYIIYYEMGLQLLKANGVMIFDNTLWHGYVADPTNHDNTTRAIRQLNERLYQDKTIDILILPIGDGMTLVRKK